MKGEKPTEITTTNNEHNAVHVPQNPFQFTPEKLMDLIDPKNIDMLNDMGNVEGVMNGLHVDVDGGINDAEESNDGDSSTTRALDRLLAPSGPSFQDRMNVYGKNQLPPAESKTIFQLMWDALQDKMLLLLLGAAIISLGTGLYQDFNPNKPDPDEPKTHWIEGVAILIAVTLVVLAGSINDYQKEKQFRKLNAKKEDRLVKAFRNGEIKQVSIYSVVVGDILLLEPGDVACADGILINGMNLRMDESAATGESDTIKKTAQQDPFIVSGSKVSEGIGRFVVIAVGTSSFHGKTTMALRTEDEDTPLQVKLDGLAELIAKIGAAVGLTMFLILILKYTIQTVGRQQGEDAYTREEITQQVLGIFLSAVTLVVVAVPEGLPLAVTLSLAYATKRMIKDNNLVRVLSACETMGGATTVCSDKTGTLTQNKMTVVKGIIARDVAFEDDHEIKSLVKDIKPQACITSGEIKTFSDVLAVLTEGIAINTSVFEDKNSVTGQVTLIGSKTDTSLLEFVKKFGLEHFILRTLPWITVVQVYPFSSERKSMATLVKIDPSKVPNASSVAQSQRPFYRIYVKGASEIVLKYCDKAIVTDVSDSVFKIISLSNEISSKFHRTIDSFAEESLRTICLGFRDWTENEFQKWLNGPIRQKVDEARKEEFFHALQADKLVIRQDPNEESNAIEIKEFENPHKVTKPSDEPLTDSDVLSHPIALNELAGCQLTCISIVGIEDPLRPGVLDAVRTCQKAGVVVRMVTGDNIITAKSIATKCGIFTKNGIAMEGSVFRKLGTEEMDLLIPKLQVLARSSPTDKKLLVERLKVLGETVAVTGDGTNDGPALKMADIGFSMGISGTEVAKEASSIILMDDNFASIVKAMMWGRAVNDAVKKFLQFQLTVNVTAVVVTVISSALDSAESSVLTVVQLLWLNLIMDTLGALALATEGPSAEILDRPPENKRSPLITFGMWKLIFFQSSLQIAINFTLLFAGPDFFSLTALQNGGGFMNANTKDEDVKRERLVLRTIVFNTFVFLQIFNLIKGISKNSMFYLTFIFVFSGQLFIIFFGNEAFKTTPLTLPQWIVSMSLGLLSLPWGAVIRLIPDELFTCFGMKPDSAPKVAPEPDVPAITSTAALNSSSKQPAGVVQSSKTDLKVFSAIRSSGRIAQFSSSKQSLNNQSQAGSQSSLSQVRAHKSSNVGSMTAIHKADSKFFEKKTLNMQSVPSLAKLISSTSSHDIQQSQPIETEQDVTVAEPEKPVETLVENESEPTTVEENVLPTSESPEPSHDAQPEENLDSVNQLSLEQ